ncbi:hypothetical protein H4R99_006802 [Coemansia sp. RSA 1722]|nr:hypothetical protein H4R99_006802 [Coemansia sp. RSA 1722]
MLPTKNRFQSKKTRPFSSRSVVLSSEPIIHKGDSGSGDRSVDKVQSTASAVAAPSEWVVVEEEQQPTKSALPEAAKEKTKVKTRTTSASQTVEGGGPGHGSSIGADSSTSTSEQYTYITDENGYTWLYDTVYGQYYYYDTAQGTYVPYGGDYVTTPTTGEAGVASATIAGAGSDEATKGGADGQPANKHNGKKRRVVRMAGGEVWEDPTLDDWPENDYRLFAGDLGPEVTSEVLEQAFGKFNSLQRTHVVCDKKTEKSKGYGFISFGNPDDFLKAWKEFNGKYVGSRPIKLRNSNWKQRNVDIRKVKRQDKRAFLEFKHKRK